MSWFSCKHPASRLMVQSRTPSVEVVNEDYEKVTFHLYCLKCGEKVNVSCSAFRGGVDAFIARGKPTGGNREH